MFSTQKACKITYNITITHICYIHVTFVMVQRIWLHNTLIRIILQFTSESKRNRTKDPDPGE